MANLFYGLVIVFSSILYNNPNERMADAHYSNRNIPEAIHYYSEALKEDPDNAVLYFKRARAHLWNNEYGKYNEDIRKALEIDPDLPRKLSNRELTDTRSSDDNNY